MGDREQRDAEHPFGDEAALLGVCETCGVKPCVCPTPMTSDQASKLEAWQENQRLRDALEQAEQERDEHKTLWLKDNERARRAERERDEARQEIEHPFDKSEFAAMQARLEQAERKLAASEKYGRRWHAIAQQVERERDEDFHKMMRDRGEP